MEKAFRFFSEAHCVMLLGIKSRNPIQLLEGIKKVPSSSIYYHTHRFLQQHYRVSPEPPNDFAYWITNILGLRELGESISSVDIINVDSLEDLRKEYVTRLENHILSGEYISDCIEGHEFHFFDCKTFVYPTPFIAKDVDELREDLEKVHINSLCFHIFEPKLRYQRRENDFSAWLRNIGEEKLADQISRLDPYAFTLEGLRQKIIRILGRDD
ncbi:MAG TPA: DUF5752 family protein [Acetomicrobium sp.]|nr:DUF5752 family protein [Acetomicrobium sp.]